MDKKELFESVSNLETQIGELYQQLSELKQHIVELIEENHALQIENDYLRKQIEDKPQKTFTSKKNKNNMNDVYETLSEIGEGYDNLARLYQEGFHICNIHFGSPRRDEDCLFCLSFLNKK